MKEATRLKTAKQFDEAIVVLHKAYEQIRLEGGGHVIETYLRLPMLFLLAGRRDEAWQEYNRLLVSTVTAWSCDSHIGPIEDSQIYDKMRLMLQREGDHRAALKMGALSHLFWAKGLKRQHRKEELSFYRSSDGLSQMLDPLLKKANALEVRGKLLELLKHSLAQLEELDPEALGKQIDMLTSAGESPT